MFSADLEGERVFLVVAQRPFETGATVMNLFCTLQPILMDDGSEANAEDFPDNGLVWWMVLAGARSFAEPGRLLTATLEQAHSSGTPGKCWYQVKVDSVEPARPTKLVEIIRAPGNWVSDPREIVSSGRWLTLDHPPMEKLYLTWHGNIYGPLKATAKQAREGRWSVALSPDHSENLVSQIPEEALRKLPAGKLHELTVHVSLVDDPADSSDLVQDCSFLLVMQADFTRYVEKEGGSIVLEGDESLIRRYARTYLSRKSRQEFNRLLDQLGDQITADPSANDAEATRVVKAVAARVGRADVAADELARCLLESGILEPRLRPLLDQAEARHIEKNTAKLQAEIDAKVGQIRSDLEVLERDWAARKQRLEHELSLKRAENEKALADRQHEFERECEAERERLRSQKQELDRQSMALSGNLQQVAQRMAEGRDALVNQFLAIAPLLQRFGMITEVAPVRQSPSPSDEAAPKDRRPQLTPPAFIAGQSPGQPVKEEEFFDRFHGHVERSGYRYRPIDLAGFHLSVKCHDLTILGGPPGTGKSSLPRLYAEALLGEEDDEGGSRYLHVAVSPSWLDMRDLLGQTNLLDHSFQPAESGLYPLLVWAQEEHGSWGPDSRIYVVCLDEMNLAQVEHYFSGFLQALERVPGQREIRCFVREMVGPEDPFARWPILNLPPSVRFIGTVNFDETTRQLSQRVLDRCNLIHLPPRYSLDAEPPKKLVAPGAAVTHGQVAGWVTESAGFDRAQGELLDALNEPLAKMGCPLNPRRYHAIRRVLSNVPSFVCSPAEALDLQIAQRVLPQVRNLFRPGAREGLKALRRALESAPFVFPESLDLLGEIEERETDDELFSKGADV
jgi:hypothetical protein